MCVGNPEIVAKVPVNEITGEVRTSLHVMQFPQIHRSHHNNKLNLMLYSARFCRHSSEETQHGDGGVELNSSFRAGVALVAVLPAGLRADVGLFLHSGAGTYSYRYSAWSILGASGCVRAFIGSFVGHRSHRRTPWRRHAAAWRHQMARRSTLVFVCGQLYGDCQTDGGCPTSSGCWCMAAL